MQNREQSELFQSPVDSFPVTRPWQAMGSKTIDHHLVDESFARMRLENGRMFRWQYVDSALRAIDEGHPLRSFITVGSLTDSDRENLSARRYMAEELGLLVGDFRLDYDAGVAEAPIRQMTYMDLPPAPQQDRRGRWLDAAGGVLSRDEVDRWFSASFLIEYMSARDHSQDKSLAEQLREYAMQAVHNGRIEVTAPDADYRGRLSAVRRMLVLSGCEVGEFQQIPTNTADNVFVAEVPAVDAKLSLV